MKNCNYACNSYGNMEEITSSQDRMKKYTQKIVGRKKPLSKLAKIAIAAGMVTVAGIAGVAGYVNEWRNPSPVYTANNSQDESIAERRTRLLRQANAQLMTAETAEDINGLSRVISDIGNGLYDHQ